MAEFMKDQLLMSDALSAESIRKGIHTVCFGREVMYLPSTESTNLIARKLAREGAKEGTLVVADYQTQGRGRLERSWWSPPGENLLFSVIFRPPFEVVHSYRLTVVSSLAVAHALRQATGLEALIKWPNDIYINAKKVSGILSELGIEDNRLRYVIMGIGININSNPPAFPEISEIATSLYVELGREFPRMRVLKYILELMERYYHLLKEGNFNSLRKAWDELSLIKGKKVKVVSSGFMEEGIAESLDDEGFLILRELSGERKRIVSADVSLSLV